MIRLTLNELAIGRTVRHELLVGPLVPVMIHHHDAMGLSNRGQAVRNNQDATAHGRLIHGVLDQPFGFGVQGTGGFVKNEQLGMAEESWNGKT